MVHSPFWVKLETGQIENLSVANWARSTMLAVTLEHIRTFAVQSLRNPLVALCKGSFSIKNSSKAIVCRYKKPQVVAKQPQVETTKLDVLKCQNGRFRSKQLV